VSNLDIHITEQMDYDTFVQTISSIPSCIFFKDKDLRYRFSTHYWAQLTGDSIVGKTDLEVRKDKENAIRAMNEDRSILEEKEGRNYIIESNIDGNISHLEIIKEPVYNSDGEPIGIVGLINDVTEKILMEKKIVGISEMLEIKCQELAGSNEELKSSLDKVEQMHASQKLFTASMNHELRNPLNGVIGNLQLLLDDESLSSEQRDIIRNAYGSSQYMLEIVNELLDFAKLEMTGITVKHEEVDIDSILDNIEFMAKTQAKFKNLEFSMKRDISLSGKLISDGTKISQIMHNFVSNAIKYTEKGSISLSVSCTDNLLVISCKDTGQGISEASMKQLFDPFTRFNEKRNVNVQGTGLGLSVVKRIIDCMEGEISVESKVDEGSTFTAKIPVEIVSESDDKKVYNNASSKEFDLSKLKVLCVDDSKVNVKVMQVLLSKEGMKVDTAYSAKEAIVACNEDKYDVVFMDHMMPEMDGIEAFHIIRKSSIYNDKTPVVMLTGNAASKYEEYYKEQGVDGYLIKPILKEQVLRMIRDVVKTGQETG